MKETRFTITENTALNATTFRLVLKAKEASQEPIARPGQFVNIQIPGLYLRRPLSVCYADCEQLLILYKVVGQGTQQLAQAEVGTMLDILIDLGNGYDLTQAGDCPVLVGGGIGVPPLYYLACELRKQGKTVQVVLGFNTKAEIILTEEFKALGCTVEVCTMDGSYGTKGVVTDIMPKAYSYFYTCGPLPMLKALYATTQTSGEFSLEERMGCGFGACMGCTCETKSGHKRVCKEGPVFKKEDLKW